MIFLLGSGASHSEMPSTEQITDRVLSGERVARHSNGCYFFGPPLYGRETDEDVNRVIRLTHLVRSICEAYYLEQPGRQSNYEDYYYIVSQINDSVTGEFDNPAIQALIDHIRLDVEQILAPPYLPGSYVSSFENIFQESIYYIHDVSRMMLTRQPSDLDDQLLFLRQAIDELSQVDIFTLNHDTIIEQTLSRARIPFVDGFEFRTRHMRIWEPSLFSETESTRLFKLHGSIDWHRVTSEQTGRWQIAQISNDDPFHLGDPSGERFIDPTGRPIMLLGTFNKMLYYTAGLYSDLHCHFHYSLNEGERLAVCGYGFRDKGINTKIAQWITQTPERRIIVIHPQPSGLFTNARGVIANNWRSWQNNGQLRIVEASAQDIAWEDLRREIF